MIRLIEPQGYCMGVKRAIKILDEVLEGNYPRPIYLVGKLIHNDIVINKYIKQGVIILDEHEKEKAIAGIREGTLVFQAHGTGKDVFRLAKSRGFTIVDATCKVVKLIHEKITNYLNEGYSIIYIGKNRHSESEAVLTISKDINFVTSLADIKNLNINNDKIYVTNQTTLSLIDLADIFNAIKDKFPKAIIDNKLCLATTKRQNAILEAEDDLIIVVGDKNSSNTMRLYELAKRKTCALMVSNLEELLSYNIDKTKNIGITSGASTPKELVLEIYNYLIKQSLITAII